MMIWDVLLATFIVMSGLSVEVIGETNCYHTAVVAQSMLSEQFVEWTVFNQYISGQAISHQLEERKQSYQITTQPRVVGSVLGIEVYVENEETHATSRFFISSV